MPDRAAAALAEVSRWPGPGQRDSAERLLEILIREVALGQRQLLLRVSEWTADEVSAEVLDLLRSGLAS